MLIFLKTLLTITYLFIGLPQSFSAHASSTPASAASALPPTKSAAASSALSSMNQPIRPLNTRANYQKVSEIIAKSINSNRDLPVEILIQYDDGFTTFDKNSQEFKKSLTTAILQKKPNLADRVHSISETLIGRHSFLLDIPEGGIVKTTIGQHIDGGSIIKLLNDKNEIIGHALTTSLGDFSKLPKEVFENIAKLIIYESKQNNTKGYSGVKDALKNTLGNFISRYGGFIGVGIFHFSAPYELTVVTFAQNMIEEANGLVPYMMGHSKNKKRVGQYHVEQIMFEKIVSFIQAIGGQWTLQDVSIFTLDNEIVNELDICDACKGEYSNNLQGKITAPKIGTNKFIYMKFNYGK